MSEMTTIGKKLRRLAVIGAAIGACTASLAAGTATAATPQPATPHTQMMTMPMKVVGFNAAVAVAHGYQIKRAATGQEYSVKAGVADAVTPQNRINSGCGYAWIYVTGVQNVTVQVDTGFVVNAPATSFAWQFFLADNGGISNHSWGSGLNNQTAWHITQVYGGMTAGPVHGWVTLASHATLYNGAVCGSGGPESYSTIFP